MCFSNLVYRFIPESFTHELCNNVHTITITVGMYNNSQNPCQICTVNTQGKRQVLKKLRKKYENVKIDFVALFYFLTQVVILRLVTSKTSNQLASVLIRCIPTRLAWSNSVTCRVIPTNRHREIINHIEIWQVIQIFPLYELLRFK